MKESKNKKTVIIILISITLILIIGIIGYKIFSNNREKKHIDSTVERLDLNSDIVKKIEKVWVTNNCDTKRNLENINDSIEAKLLIAYKQLSENDKTDINCNEVTDIQIDQKYYCGTVEYDKLTNFLLDDGTINMNNEFISLIKSNTTERVPAEKLKTKMQELFGKEINYNNQDIPLNFNCEKVHYDEKLDSYILFKSRICGGSCGGTQSIKSATKKKDIIELTVLEEKNSYNKKEINIIYKFQLEKETNNYIFIERKIK